jgi:hypothetical protein
MLCQLNCYASHPRLHLCHHTPASLLPPPSNTAPSTYNVTHTPNRTPHHLHTPPPHPSPSAKKELHCKESKARTLKPLHCKHYTPPTPHPPPSPCAQAPAGWTRRRRRGGVLCWRGWRGNPPPSWSWGSRWVGGG